MEELLPHDVIEHHILERLDVKTLLRLKSVSKQWKSTIQSTYFQKRQLIHHQVSQSRRVPNVLLVCANHNGSDLPPDPKLEDLRSLVVGSWSGSSSVSVTWWNKGYDVCNTSCDGLICLYDIYGQPSIVVNHSTRWHRSFPQCNYQLVAAEKAERDELFNVPYPSLGFGKDKISGTYKPVWVYNSSELRLNDKATTCEVFDFATNAWRYVVPASPHLILHTYSPVYLDGSLHWFTASSNHGETMVLSFDLHSETFQVISKVPFYHDSGEFTIVMCNLDDRLCVSQENWPNQFIWSFDSDHKTWRQIYSIDLDITSSWFEPRNLPLSPLAVLDKEKLLFYDHEDGNPFVSYDPNTKSYDLARTSKLWARVVCYFPSLISIL